MVTQQIVLKLDMHVPQLNNKMWWKFRRQWEHCEKASRLSVEEKKERTAILKAGEWTGSVEISKKERNPWQCGLGRGVLIHQKHSPNSSSVRKKSYSQVSYVQSSSSSFCTDVSEAERPKHRAVYRVIKLCTAGMSTCQVSYLLDFNVPWAWII